MINFHHPRENSNIATTQLADEFLYENREFMHHDNLTEKKPNQAGFDREQFIKENDLYMPLRAGTKISN
jgi:hypothetical protein